MFVWINNTLSSDRSTKVSSFFSSRMKIFEFTTLLPEQDNPKHWKEADCAGICPFHFTKTWANNLLYSFLYTVEGYKKNKKVRLVYDTIKRPFKVQNFKAILLECRSLEWFFFIFTKTHFGTTKWWNEMLVKAPCQAPFRMKYTSVRCVLVKTLD